VLTYAVTAVSPYGETTPSTSITVANAPGVLNGTDSVQLTWAAVPGAVEYRVYGRRGGTLRRLVALNNSETWTNPETTWIDDGSATEGALSPPTVNSAQVEQVLANGTSAFGWGRLVLALGAVDVHTVYASNLATGATPARARLPESAYGTEFLVPGQPGWPHPDPYIEIGGIRQTVIYARGPRLDHHRNGTVTIAWNGCGAEEVGDGTGRMIDQAFPTLQWFLNEHVLKNDGAGYRTGDYGPLVTYTNGDSVLKTTAFAACQTLTASWIGGAGYLAAFALTEPTSLRDILRRFCTTFACHLGADHFGRIYPVLIDDTADPTLGRLYRDRIDVRRLVNQRFDHEAVETRITFHYDFDTDANQFRVKDQVIEDTAASAAHFSPREKSPRSCYYTRDRTTAFDANGRHLTRYKIAPRYVSIETDLTGLEDENGSQIRLTHYDGASSSAGDVETPMLVIRHAMDPTAPESTTLGAFDLSRILSTGFAPLVTDASSTVLGDETSYAAPPTGAYELR
jgi:hypothetical protein